MDRLKTRATFRPRHEKTRTRGERWLIFPQRVSIYILLHLDYLKNGEVHLEATKIVSIIKTIQVYCLVYAVVLCGIVYSKFLVS